VAGVVVAKQGRAAADGEAVRLRPDDVPEMHPPGWTEISAVCTDDAWRGFSPRVTKLLTN